MWAAFNMANVRERSGKYVNQPTGYRAFIPAPLPPDPPIDLSGDLLVRLSEAQMALGRLDGSVQTLPDSDIFVFMYVRKEAVLSSQIEGTQSSLQDVLNAEAKIFRQYQPNDVDEVINYVAAMNYGLERIRELPLSIRLIREIHEKLLSGVRGSRLQPGELRTSQNWIGAANCTINEAVFVPPPPQHLIEALGDLELFLHQPNGLPPLIKMGLVHAQFETIHPFLDGNGRMGRLLITFLLCQQEILLKPVLYLSHYFKKYRNDYYDRLQAVRDNGDWEGWLGFFLRGVAEVSAEAHTTVRRILAMREEHRVAITEQLGSSSGNGHRVLEILFRKPLVTVSDVQDMTGSSYPAANSLVSRLVNIGVLREATGNRRNRVFRYAPYIAIFAEGTEEFSDFGNHD